MERGDRAGFPSQNRVAASTASLHGALTWASRSPPAARGHSRARGELLALRTRGQGEKRQVSGGENGTV